MLQKKIFSLMVICLLTVIGIYGQSATADVLDAGRTYLEGNVWTSVQSHKNGGEQVYGGRFAYGLKKKIEIGIGGSFSSPNDAEYPPELQPALKWKFYDNENYGVKAAVGTIAYLPIAKRSETDTFVMVYSNISKDVKKLKNARLTIGGYALIGHNKSFGSNKGWNLMYEQPLTEKLNFSTQWVTGKNRFGYLTPGFSVATSKKTSLFLGYSVGNYDYDNHGPYISFSVLP
jgi:hypothetical protein